MKRIAIFCDGTWSGVEQPDPTNVRRMAVMVPPRGADGTGQLPLYFQGVGVPESGGWIERINEKLSGGAMGFGLDDKIAVAFEHLCRNYEAGDAVHVFGFSRGAYTARSLVGLIRNCGLPRKPSDAVVRECFAFYRERGKDSHPDAPRSLEFRLRMSPDFTTSDKEAAFRRERGVPEGQPFSVAYLGVWDTVGALGIPSHWGLPARFLNQKYLFHDTDLSSMVLSARHAVAVDERRRPYVPTLWDNLPALRDKNPDGEYLQEWFPGNHGSVGGGGDVVGLSHLALMWIANGAIRAGLGFDEEKLALVRRDCDLMASLHNRRGGPSLGEKLLGVGGRARGGPDAIGGVAHPAVRRWRMHNGYRPKPLHRLSRDLDGFDEASILDYSAVTVV